ncbi:MAG: hypothetical protein ACK4NM_18580, partial [Hydrogenophaga sp.]
AQYTHIIGDIKHQISNENRAAVHGSGSHAMPRSLWPHTRSISPQFPPIPAALRVGHCVWLLFTMRPLTEDETRQLFEKLAKLYACHLGGRAVCPLPLSLLSRAGQHREECAQLDRPAGWQVLLQAA